MQNLRLGRSLGLGWCCSMKFVKYVNQVLRLHGEDYLITEVDAGII